MGYGTNVYRITLAEGGGIMPGGGELGATLSVKNHQENHREKVKGRSSPSKNSDPRIKEFIDWWDREYRNRFSNPYRFNGGKEGRLIKDLLHDYDLPTLQDLARRFLDSTDPWVQQTGGYTIGVFAGQINKIVSTAAANRSRPQTKAFPV